MIAPLGQLAADAGQATAPWAQTLGSLLMQWNNMAYSIGEATLGVGGLFLCSLLFRTRLIPRFLSVGGLVGYVSLMVGMIAELFGIHIGLMLSIPGIFFEVGLPVWLFIKGFQPEAYGGRRPGSSAIGATSASLSVSVLAAYSCWVTRLTLRRHPAGRGSTSA